MSGQVISVTIQFYTDKDKIAIPQVNEIVNRAIKSILMESNLKEVESSYCVQIRRKDG